jgi:hypothetical protein
LPLRVRILLREPEKDDFAFGESLTCDVALANVTERPVTIPWSSGRVSRPDSFEDAKNAGYEDAYVAFLLLDGPVNHQSLYVHRLDSLVFEPDTFKTILPGEEVAIRVRFSLKPDNEARLNVFRDLPEGMSARVRLGASFVFNPNGLPRGSVSALSENSIPIKLAPRL